MHGREDVCAGGRGVRETHRLGAYAAAVLSRTGGVIGDSQLISFFLGLGLGVDGDENDLTGSQKGDGWVECEVVEHVVARGCGCDERVGVDTSRG